MNRPAALEAWHRLVASHDPAGLDALLADDAVFHSPVVHTPQRGLIHQKMAQMLEQQARGA